MRKDGKERIDGKRKRRKERNEMKVEQNDNQGRKNQRHVKRK